MTQKVSYLSFPVRSMGSPDSKCKGIESDMKNEYVKFVKSVMIPEAVPKGAHSQIDEIMSSNPTEKYNAIFQINNGANETLSDIAKGIIKGMFERGINTNGSFKPLYNLEDSSK